MSFYEDFVTEQTLTQPKNNRTFVEQRGFLSSLFYIGLGYGQDICLNILLKH